MPVAQHARDARHYNHQPRKRRLGWIWVVAGVLLILAAAGTWVGVRGIQAKDQLQAAQGEVSQLKASILSQNTKGTNATLKSLLAHSRKAKELTSDGIWRACEILPIVGPNLTAVRQLADATSAVMANAVSPLMKMESATLNTKSLLPKGGAINTAALQSAVAPVTSANAALHTERNAVAAINTSQTIGAVKAAKTKLLTLLDSVNPLMQTLTTVLPLLPPALGAQAPRNYLIIFENNAEARALGGTALSTALVTIDKGHIHLSATQPGVAFKQYPTSVIPVPDGVADLYGGSFGKFIANVTVRPDFASTAEMTKVMWERQFGGTVDGVISIDPVALSYILRATTPIALPSGDVLTSDSLVPLLLNTVYQRYWTKNVVADSEAQGVIYSEAVAATFARLSSGALSPQVMLAALAQATSERRLMLWSSHANEQAQFVKSDLSGALPKSDKKTDRVGLYVQDAIGSKMDYYLTQTATLSQGACRADRRANYRVTLALTNTAPADAKTSLSSSILGQSKVEHVPLGYQRMYVYLYAPPGSTITGSTADGVPVALIGRHDTDYPVQRVLVQFAPGATETVTFNVVAAKAGVKKLEAQITPMVHATPVTTAPLDCASVPKG
jgi:hypothetical protein